MANIDAAALEARFSIQGDEADLDSLATIAGGVTFYFTDPKRNLGALASLYESFLHRMGAGPKYIVVGQDTKRARKFRADDRKLVARWAQSSSTASEGRALSVRAGGSGLAAWSFELSTTPSTTAAGRKLLEALQAKGSYVPDPRGPRTSYVTFTVPVDMVTPNPSPLRDLVIEASSELVFRSGYAGFTLAYDARAVAYRRDLQVRAWIMRLHGLDIGSPHGSAAFASTRIRGVSWLTLLSNDLLEQAGGRRAVDALGPDIVLYSLPHGAAIQAGATPRLGDVNELEDMTPYMKVNRLLEPIRADDMYPPIWMKRDEAREWLARFDER